MLQRYLFDGFILAENAVACYIVGFKISQLMVAVDFYIRNAGMQGICVYLSMRLKDAIVGKYRGIISRKNASMSTENPDTENSEAENPEAKIADMESRMWRERSSKRKSRIYRISIHRNRI